jgi:tetratricopeptide (TPR) repeat protein
MDTRGRRWLLILDHADEAEYLLQSPAATSQEHHSTRTPSGNRRLDYIPTCDHGTVLITTRRRDMCLKMVHRNSMLEIRAMDVDHALELMQKKIGMQDHEDDVIRLATALDFMPLAMAQAATYIHKRAPRCSVQQYTEKLHRSQKSKLSLLNRDETDLRRDREASNSIISTWQISFEHVRNLRPSAADLLSFMSFLDRQAIPETLLLASIKHYPSDANENGCDNDVATKDSTDHDLGDSQSDSGSSVDELEEDIQLLRDYSFISVTSDPEFFEMHALVQLATQKWLGANGRHSQWKIRFIEVLTHEFSDHESESMPRAKILFPHAFATLHLDAADTHAQPMFATLLLDAGHYAYKTNAYADAEQLLTKSLMIATQIAGNEHVQTLCTMYYLACTYDVRMRPEKAEQLFLQVLSIVEPSPEEDIGPIKHYNLRLWVMSRLSAMYREQGRLVESEVLGIRIMMHAVNAKDTLVGLKDVTATYNSQGRWLEAAGLLRQAIEGFRDVDGPAHEDTVDAVQTLGELYLDNGRLETAERMFSVVRHARKIVPGSDDLGLSNLRGLGMTYVEQGRLDEAELAFSQILESMSTQLGMDHPSTLENKKLLALVYQKKGRLAEAEEIYSQVLESQTLTFGTDHYSSLSALALLGGVQCLQRRYNALEITCRSLLEIKTRVFGMAHFSTLVTMADLAWALHWLGKTQLAVELMARCAALSFQTLGPTDPDSVDREDWARRGMEVDTEQEEGAPGAVSSPSSAVMAGEEQQTARSVEDDIPGGRAAQRNERANEKALE